MSALDRTALRLATVLALTNNDVAPYPTMAEGRIFDSLPDPTLLDFSAGSRLPVVIVHIDSDRSASLSAQNGGGPWRPDVQLLIELKVVQTADEDGEVGVPATSPQMETALDLLEHQVQCALFGGGKWAGLWQTLAGRVMSWDSDRYHDPWEALVRFVEREIAVECVLTWREHAQPPVAIIAGDPQPTALPRPIRDLLAAVSAAQAAGEPVNAYVAQQVATINAYTLPGAVTLPRLESLRIVEADHATLGGLDGQTPKGPRPAGVADLEF